jgi:hypothetical protein
LGLPESGKSTFIAALWYVLSAIDNKFDLKVNKMGDDMEYLNDIKTKWLKCEKLLRTGSTIVKNIVMSLKYNDNMIIDIDIPDINGELFDNLIETRKCDEEFTSLAKQSNGLLLFINPNVNYPFRIDEISDVLGSEHTNEESSEESEKFEIKNIPTQVKIIELLQFIEEIKNYEKTRLIVLISAWDLIMTESINLTPSEFIKKKLPMLYQFLNSHSNIFDYKIIGLSAQGGDYASSESVTNLVKHLNPLERIVIVTESENFNDITYPIRNLIDNESNK